MRREIQRGGAVATVPAGLAGPTILEQGPDVARERFLRPLLTGEEVWCQLFSEPSAGSDLAGLTTTAVLDGDEWVVNGQKVWNTSAHHADLGMLLARTDWDAPKHQGITYFVLPMKQPGVEVRPLRQMNFHASFNEVFLTDARIPKDWVVGEVNQGWTAALATLAHERHFGALGRARFDGIEEGPALDEARAEAAEIAKVYAWYPQRAGRVDLVVDHARARRVAARPGRSPGDRPAAVDAPGERVDGRAGQGGPGHRPAARTRGLDRQARAQPRRAPGGTSPRHDRRRRCDARRHRPAQPARRHPRRDPLSVPAQSIAGGTDEIQRNILGERSLGLPRAGSRQGPAVSPGAQPLT